MQLKKQQKYLRVGGLLAFIVLLNTVCPLSTDMYMPSLPTIASEFGVSSTEINSTLYLYFLFLAIGILLIGPVSDKYGRKKLLVLSTSVYTIMSFVCFISPNLITMIAARCVQGFAAGGMLSVMTAVIKDSFEGRSRAIVLSLAQALGSIAPILAPILGAAVVQVASWHYVFLILTCIGGVMVLLSLLYQETIPKDEIVKGSAFASYKGLSSVLKNKNFTLLLLTVAMFCAPFMAYLGNATYIYQDTFGCTTLQFSLFFATAAAVSIIGTIIPIYLSKNINLAKVRISGTVTIILGFIGALLVLTIGRLGPIVFLTSFIVYMIGMSFIRPFMTDVILKQHDGETGSAAAVLNFIINVCGSIGMIIGSMPWGSYLLGLGITMLGFLVLAATFWVLSCRCKLKI